MVLCEFAPLVRLEPPEARQRSAGFTVTRQSPEEMRALCREVGLDLGLVVAEDDPSRLHFREPFLLRVVPVDVVVRIQGEYGHVEVQVTGYRDVNWSIVPPRYLDRLVHALADRAQHGGKPSPDAFETPQRVRGRRMMLGYLRVIQWIPLALLVPLVVVTQVYGDGLKPVAILVAWCYLVVAVPLAASVFHRRIAGVGSPWDLIPLAVVTGVFVVGIALWLVFAGLKVI